MKSKSILKKIVCAAVAVATAASLSSCVMPLSEAKDFTAPSTAFVVANAPAVSSRRVIIKASPAKIRSGPGRQYSVIARTKKGKSFVYLGSKSDKKGNVWYKIQYTNQTRNDRILCYNQSDDRIDYDNDGIDTRIDDRSVFRHDDNEAVDHNHNHKSLVPDEIRYHLRQSRERAIRRRNELRKDRQRVKGQEIQTARHQKRFLRKEMVQHSVHLFKNRLGIGFIGVY